MTTDRGEWRAPLRPDYLGLRLLSGPRELPAIAHSLDDFAVTHRPVTVTARTLSHGRDGALLGRVRIKRAGRPRVLDATPDLVGRSAAIDDREASAPPAPPVQRTRRIPVATRTADRQRLAGGGPPDGPDAAAIGAPPADFPSANAAPPSARRPPEQPAQSGRPPAPSLPADAPGVRQRRRSPDRTGSDRTGSDRTGSDRTGSDRTGSDRTGSDRTAFAEGDAASAAFAADTDLTARRPSVPVTEAGSVSSGSVSSGTVRPRRTPRRAPASTPEAYLARARQRVAAGTHPGASGVTPAAGALPPARRSVPSDPEIKAILQDAHDGTGVDGTEAERPTDLRVRRRSPERNPMSSPAEAESPDVAGPEPRSPERFQPTTGGPPARTEAAGAQPPEDALVEPASAPDAGPLRPLTSTRERQRDGTPRPVTTPPAGNPAASSSTSAPHATTVPGALGLAGSGAPASDPQLLVPLAARVEQVSNVASDERGAEDQASGRQSSPAAAIDPQDGAGRADADARHRDVPPPPDRRVEPRAALAADAPRDASVQRRPAASDAGTPPFLPTPALPTPALATNQGLDASTPVRTLASQPAADVSPSVVRAFDSEGIQAPDMSPRNASDPSASERAPDSPPGSSVARGRPPGASDSSAPTGSAAAAEMATVPVVRGSAPIATVLPPSVRAAVHAVTGVSPPAVQVRSDATVTRHAQVIRADAFTRDGVVHIPHTVALSSDHGRRLLAHEATHVVQQASLGTAVPSEHALPGRTLERQARAAEAMIGPPSASPPPRSAVAQPLQAVPADSPGATALAGSTARPPTGALPGPDPSGPMPLPSAVPRRLRARAVTMAPPVRGVIGVSSDATPRSSGTSPTGPGIAAGERPRPSGATAAAAAGPDRPAQLARPAQPRVPRVAHMPSVPVAPILTARMLPTSRVGEAATALGDAPSAGSPPTSASSSPAAPQASSGQGNGIQRRASGSGASTPTPASSPTPVTAPSAAPRIPGPTGNDEHSAHTRAAPDTALDPQWLERHAAALYPLLRGLLRAELLRDRERRGRLMREE